MGNGKAGARDRDLERQMWTATEAIREAIREAMLQLLRVGVSPPVLVLAATRVAGELGADAAREGGEDVENLLGELAGILREAGLRHHATFRAGGPPVAGNA
jgi:hypothetical protein